MRKDKGLWSTVLQGWWPPLLPPTSPQRPFFCCSNSSVKPLSGCKPAPSRAFNVLLCVMEADSGCAGLGREVAGVSVTAWGDIGCC